MLDSSANIYSNVFKWQKNNEGDNIYEANVYFLHTHLANL